MRKIIIVLLLLLITAGILFFYLRPSVSVPVKIITVKRNDFTVAISAATTASVKSNMEINISPQMSGRLIKFPLKEGDTVKKGEVVAQIDEREVRLQVEQAGESLNQARSRLEQIRIEIDLLKKTISTQIAETKATLDEAEGEIKRKQKLFDDGLISYQERDMAIRARDVAAARYENAIANKTQINIKEQELSAVNNRIKELKAALSLSQLQMEYSTIHSPIDGVVSKRFTEVGENVIPGAALLRLIDPDDLYIEVAIDEYDAKHLKVSQEAMIRLDAFPGKEFSGTVLHVSPVVIGERQQTRTFLVRVKFKEKNIKVVPGMSADVEIIADKVANIISIPTSTIVEREQKKMVYVVREGKAFLTPITKGITTWNASEVTSGLSEGDRIVINPEVLNLQDGIVVKSEP